MSKRTGVIRPTGKPRMRIPKDAEEVIRKLAAEGHSHVGIAAALGCCKNTLTKWMDENPLFRDAMEQGRERERFTLHNVLFTAATVDKNCTAAMFLLKSRHGYREGDQGEQGNRVSINFTLPGAMKLEDFKAIENDRSNDSTQ